MRKNTPYYIINNIISKLKGERFELDASIPLAYLMSFLLKRLGMLLSSIWKLKRGGVHFVHYSTHVLCASKIKCGKNFSIDRNCYLDALSVEGMSFGDNVSIGKNTTIECSGSLKNIGKGLRIGNNVGLGSHGFWGCAGGIEVGNDTIFGNYVSLHSENHNFSDCHKPVRLQGVTRKGIKIGAGCWIGAKVTILDGTKLGDGCIVAAGAVVRGTFPTMAIIGGIPAKILKMRGETR